MNLNKVFLIGRLTADPQLRSTASSQSVTNFGFATNRYWVDKDGKRQEDTEFHNIVLWGRQAEVATQFLKKGSVALIEGRLQTRTWQDKEGQNRKTTEIVAERVQFGPRAGGEGREPFAPSAPVASSSASSAAAKKATPGEDMPFDEPIPQIDLDDEIRAEDIPF